MVHGLLQGYWLGEQGLAAEEDGADWARALDTREAIDKCIVNQVEENIFQSV